MADRVPFQPISVRARSDTGEVQYYGDLAQRLQGFTNRTFNRLERVKLNQAERDARVDALAGNFRPSDKTTLAAEVYNNTGYRIYAAETVTDIARRVPEIEKEASGAVGMTPPEYFDAHAEGYRELLLKEMPPEVAEAVLPVLDQQLITAGNRVRSAHQQAEHERSRAATNLALEGVSDMHARAVLDGDPEAIALLEEMYSQQIEAAIQDGTYSEAEAITIAGKHLNRVVMAAQIGQFARALEEGTALGFLESFRKNPPLHMSPEEHQEALGKMFSRLSDKQRLEDEAETIESNERVERHREIERELTLIDLRGSLTPELVEQMVENDDIDSGRTDYWLERANDPGPRFSDTGVDFVYDTSLMAFTEEEIADESKLTKERRAELIQQRRDMVADAEDWRGTQQGQEGARRIRNELGLADGIMLSGSGDKLVKQAGRALSDYYNMVETLPLEQRQAKAIEMSEEVITKIQASRQDEKMEKAQTRLDELLAVDTSDMGSAEQEMHNQSVEKARDKVRRLQGD